ncbi:glycogen/starch/alpha-glucan phosphorylase [Anaerovorax odorimutans]|uniref:Alpha-1,4 glucan phosphorylase n=1 Tax=Anaerovorax odorimutans TaxID=109327 RepID=A0ABT1RSX9_9FIRM|nr:glycogen/starch/alpha-glucan phosphorylase [Anaerovorax odorimutans]MCQ4638317.1 glycogen/starch/alpha-glucan phosphorylase [Anaerovorax odorimutans]
MFSGKEDFKEQYLAEVSETMAKPFGECTRREKYEVLAKMICSRAAKLHAETRLRHSTLRRKEVYYFSMEFLLGRLLTNYLINFGAEATVRAGLKDLGEDLDELSRMEPDPGLGNGGLGRLAACFLDSMAFEDIAATGMGARYRFGLFKQKIENGKQTEEPDPWLVNGYPWEIRNWDSARQIRFGGRVERTFENGKISFEHTAYQTVLAVPYDVPIVGYGGKTVNMLRLWQAEPPEEKIDLAAFSRGEYSEAVRERNEIEAITAILYPDDTTPAGKELRLKQEYFLTAAGIASIIDHYKHQYGASAWRAFPDRVAIHTNDTHPALCVPELMRLLLDQENLEWDDAWDIVTKTISFTNHTIMPEALEKWPIGLMQQLLPRVYMIIEEIDRRYRESFDRSLPGWQERLSSSAVLWDGQVRMANLSIIGSHSVNGVAAIHTDILKNDVFKAFCHRDSQKFNNKTNGVSHRRFLLESNPDLSELITSAIGSGWISDAGQLENLLPYGNDSAFLDELEKIKYGNKCRLASYIKESSGIIIDPASLFDVQVKRIHAYKRQLLNIFKIMHLYNRLKRDPDMDLHPHTFIFSGKAAQSYEFAKETVRLIHALADKVNSDPQVSEKIKVVFLENFGVSLGQLIYPAADISEQISTAGKEASGTGNMKFMFNGAVTLGTMDGANVEIHELAGDDNIFIFGLSAREVAEYGFRGDYHSQDICRRLPDLAQITDQLVNGFFGGQTDAFWSIHDALIRYNDEYFVLADFEDYLKTFFRAGEAFEDRRKWNRMSLANIAKAGYFTSDRTVLQYAEEIWNVK